MPDLLEIGNDRKWRPDAIDEPLDERRALAREELDEMSRRGVVGAAHDVRDEHFRRVLDAGFALAEIRETSDERIARAVGGAGFVAYYRALQV